MCVKQFLYFVEITIVLGFYFIFIYFHFLGGVSFVIFASLLVSFNFINQKAKQERKMGCQFG